MLKLDHPTDLTETPGPAVELEFLGRLIVLVPAGMDAGAAARKIWKLATNTGMQVQLLSVCSDAAREPELRRELVTMASLLQNGRVHAELKVEPESHWVDAVKRNARAEDMIVCFAEQRAGLLHRPLSQIVRSNLNFPVYILSGLPVPTLSEPPDWFPQIAGWAGSIAIIAVFFLLQIRITSLPQDWSQTTLFIISVLTELWLIWVWNSWFD